MRTFRPAAVLCGAAASILLLAGTAAAHVTLDKSSVPADSEQSLQARVPGEHPPAYNVKLILEIPAGFTVKTCADKLGWTCTITQDATNGRSALVTWTRQSGVDAIDLFDFTVHTPSRNGPYKFGAVQFYSDGSKVYWLGPPGSDHPAPVVTVTGANTQPVKNTAPPPSHRPATATPAARVPQRNDSPSPTSRQATVPPASASAAPTATGQSSAVSVASSTDPSQVSPAATAGPVIRAADVQPKDGFPLLPVGLVVAAAATVGSLLAFRRRSRA